MSDYDSMPTPETCYADFCLIPVRKPVPPPTPLRPPSPFYPFAPEYLTPLLSSKKERKKKKKGNGVLVCLKIM